MNRRLPYFVLLVVLWVPGVASAYSDPALFTEGTLEGGGGGRFFTGSPVDGYSCAVCHSGGQKPFVTVIGLPLDGYDPGVTYQIDIQWNEPLEPHALALEFVTATGQGAGTLSLPAPEQVPATAHCEQNPMSDVAAYLVQSKTRNIVGTTDCGASSVRFNFTAPLDLEIAFAATVVRGDGSGTSDGDGVVELSKVLRRRGLSSTTRGATSCAAALDGTTRSSRGWLHMSGALMLTGLFQRRRIRRAKTRFC